MLRKSPALAYGQQSKCRATRTRWNEHVDNRQLVSVSREVKSKYAATDDLYAGRTIYINFIKTVRYGKNNGSTAYIELIASARLLVANRDRAQHMPDLRSLLIANRVMRSPVATVCHKNGHFTETPLPGTGHASREPLLQSARQIAGSVHDWGGEHSGSLPTHARLKRAGLA